MRALLFATLLLLVTGPLLLKAQPVIRVNGVPIPYDAYRVELVNQLARSGMPVSDTADPDPLVRDGVLLTLVDSELTLQEGKKRGIEVTDAVVIDMIVDNPPDFIRTLFADGYDRTVMKRLLTDPSAIKPYVTDRGAALAARVEQWSEQVSSLKRFYRIREVTRRLEDSLFAEAPLDRTDLEERFIAARTALRGSVVRILHSTIPADSVPVSEEEARTWFAQNLDEYTIPESRLPLVAILPIVPSSADSAAQREKLEEIATRIDQAPRSNRNGVVADLLKDLPPSRVPAGQGVSPAAFDQRIAADLYGAEVGDIVGPYPTGDESLYLYVAGERPSLDTVVRSRHILVNKESILYPEEIPNVPEAEAEAGVLQLIEALADSIRTEDDFMRIAGVYSQDVGSGANGGDLGYRARGYFVPRFDSTIFAGEPGRLLGPIRTEFGQHLIWVVDRVARDLELVELRVPLAPSTEVYQQTMAVAGQFARRLSDGEEASSVLAEAHGLFPNVVVDSGTYLKQLEPYADGLAVTRYVYGAKVGDAAAIELPFNRVAVVQLRTVWPGGVPEFEEIALWPTEHARRKKQLDILEKQQADLAGKITPETLLGPLREHAPMAEVLLLHGQPIPVMEDEDERLLDSLAVITQPGEVTGPVRGRHALYLLRVSNRASVRDDASGAGKEEWIADYLASYRTGLFDALIEQARADATVEFPRALQ